MSVDLSDVAPDVLLSADGFRVYINFDEVKDLFFGYVFLFMLVKIR